MHASPQLVIVNHRSQQRRVVDSSYGMALVRPYQQLPFTTPIVGDIVFYAKTLLPTTSGKRLVTQQTNFKELWDAWE